MHIAVVEPEAHGRTSGGYLYNQRLAEHGAFELARVAVDTPARLSPPLAANSDVILADSLFLHEGGLAPFLALRAGGTRVGLLLHAFPSFIRRAEDRATLERELPLVPLPLELELIAGLDLVVTPGHYAARVLASSGSRVPCVVCPPGSDPSPGTPLRGPPSSSLRILTIANLTPAKGIRDAIEALAALREHAWELTLVGALDADAAYVTELRALTARHDLVGRVHFRGALTHADTQGALQASDVLLIPSHTENCPLVALEASRAGVPVVGYAVGGLPDLVDSGVSGLLVPLLDVTALTEALRIMLVNPDERSRLSAAARRAGARLPTWRDAAATFQRALLPYAK